MQPESFAQYLTVIEKKLQLENDPTYSVIVILFL